MGLLTLSTICSRDAPTAKSEASQVKQEELEEQDEKELRHVKVLPCNSQKLILLLLSNG